MLPMESHNFNLPFTWTLYDCYNYYRILFQRCVRVYIVIVIVIIIIIIIIIIIYD